MTHSELVERAVRWLAGSQRCAVVISEFAHHGGGEQPDAMGWKLDGRSVLIECKASRSDFHADRRKPWRHGSAAHLGLGIQRYYLTPRDLVKADELPDGWGLLEVRGKVVRRIRDAEDAVAYDYHHRREMIVLVKIAQRMQNGWATPSIAHIEPLPAPSPTTDSEGEDDADS